MDFAPDPREPATSPPPYTVMISMVSATASTSLPARPTPTTGDLLGLLLAQLKDYALILLDAEGRVTAWLAGAEHIFGYTAAEMVGQPASRLFGPEDRQR